MSLTLAGRLFHTAGAAIWNVRHGQGVTGLKVSD